MVIRRAAEHRLHGEPRSGQGLAAASTTMARLAPRIGVRPGSIAQHHVEIPRTAASNPMNRVGGHGLCTITYGELPEVSCASETPGCHTKSVGRTVGNGC